MGRSGDREWVKAWHSERREAAATNIISGACWMALDLRIARCILLSDSFLNLHKTVL
jgi:hypothetical protein